MQYYTESQIQAFDTLPHVTGTLSALSSIFVIQDILRDPAKRTRVYIRLVLALSTVDVFVSLSFALGTWPVPASEGTFTGMISAGTVGTCTAQGFFIQFGLAVPYYYLGLTLYYFFILYRKWPESKLLKFEKCVHVVACLLGIGTAIAGLWLKLFNNSLLWCWISSFPSSCANSRDGDGDCVRGDHAWIYRWAFYYVHMWLVVFLISILMAMVSWRVVRDESASRKWRGRSGEKNDKLRRLSRKVMWQSAHYMLAYYATAIFPSLMRAKQAMGQDVPAWIVITTGIFLPLQGFWNMLIYIKPRVERFREENDDLSLLGAACKAITQRLPTLRKSRPTCVEHEALDTTSPDTITVDIRPADHFAVPSVCAETAPEHDEMTHSRQGELLQGTPDSSEEEEVDDCDHEEVEERDADVMDPAFQYMKESSRCLVADTQEAPGGPWRGEGFPFPRARSILRMRQMTQMKQSLSAPDLPQAKEDKEESTSNTDDTNITSRNVLMARIGKHESAPAMSANDLC